MSERPPRGFSEETNATPLVRLTGDVQGPKRPCLVVIAGAHLGEIFPVEGEIIIGRDPESNLRLAEDEGVSRRHARVTPVADGALLADLGSQNGTYVDGERVQERVLKEGMKVRIGQTTVLKFARYDAVEEAAQRQLLESALRDGLTRAFNRRYFVERLGAEIRFAERHAQPLALLMLDIDHFKQLNDSHGHLIGDDVLRAVVGVLNDTLRAEDVLARYGGEEFSVLVRGVNQGWRARARRAAAPRDRRDGVGQGGRREARSDGVDRNCHLPAGECGGGAGGAGRQEAGRAGGRGPLSCEERRS